MKLYFKKELSNIKAQLKKTLLMKKKRVFVIFKLLRMCLIRKKHLAHQIEESSITLLLKRF